MSLTPDTPSAEQPEVLGWDFPPRRELPRPEVDWSRLPSAAAAVGVALILTSVIVSSTYARKTGDLDGSVFGLGVLASLGLLATSVLAELKLPGLERRAAMVSWPGAAGIAGLGVMTAVLIDSDPGSLVVGGVLVLVLSAGGYLIRRTAPFVLTGLAALTLLYGRLIPEIMSDDASDSFVIVYGGAMVAFVVVVTAAGWLLSSMQVLIGLVIGAFALASFAMSFMFMAFWTMDMYTEGYEGGGPPPNPFENDAYVLVGYTALLILFWAICAMASGHVGFRILIVAAAALLVPTSMSLLITRHPSVWQVGLGLLGGLALLVAVLRAPEGRDIAPSEPA